MLESLEREYKRDEDFCSSEKATAAEDKVAYMQQLITKMLEQKEAFLKVNTRHKQQIISLDLKFLYWDTLKLKK